MLDLLFDGSLVFLGLCLGAAIEAKSTNRGAAHDADEDLRPSRLDLDREIDPPAYHSVERILDHGFYYDSAGAERLARQRAYSQIVAHTGQWISVRDRYLLRLESGRFALQEHRRLDDGSTDVHVRLVSCHEAAEFFFEPRALRYIDSDAAREYFKIGSEIEEA